MIPVLLPPAVGVGHTAEVPLQVEFVGGSGPTVVAALVLLAVTVVLSLLITLRLVRGYAQTRARPLLYLAVGLFLLTAAPTLVQLGFVNVLDAPSSQRMVIATASKLVGLLTILYTIHQ